MPNEALISRIETLLDEVVSLGGASERTGIVSGLIVVDSAPSSPALANHIIVRDNRDGNFISVLKTPGQTYANNDLVSVLFIEGTEPIALAQSPGSSSGNVKVSEVWESDFGAVAGSADAAGNWTWQNDVTLAAGDLNFSQASIIAVTGALQINATGGIVINEGGADVDFRVESNNDANAFFVQGSDGNIGLGTGAPTEELQLVRDQNSITRIKIDNPNAGTSALTSVYMTARNSGGGASGGAFQMYGANNTATVGGVAAGSHFSFRTDTSQSGVFFMVGSANPLYFGTSDTIRALINGAGLFLIGPVATTPAAQLHVDQSGTASARPVLYLDQADVSEEFIKYVGTAANGVLTQSIVNNADVATATLVGWTKVFVEDVGNQITDQAYYQPLYTLA